MPLDGPDERPLDERIHWISMRAPLLPRTPWDTESTGQRAAPDGRTDSENSEAEVNEARDEAPRTRTSQCACALLLCIACFGAISMILREAFSGAAKSFYCSPDGTHPVAYPAPLTCAVPLSLAAVLCNLAVVGGLLCILRFAWLSGRNIAGDGPSSLAQLQRHRAKLQKDLTLWRRWSAKVLMFAGLIYLVAGAACAAAAKLALVFLATGFITLYATALFFDQDFDQARMSPRLLRFLCVYILVGLTFTALASGATERMAYGPHPHGFEGRAPRGVEEVGGLGASTIGPEDASHFADVCTSVGRQQVAPSWCTVPLDFLAGLALWWAASPVFAILMPARSTDQPNGGMCRHFLQKWRKSIDFLIMSVAGGLLLLSRKPCAHLAPIAFGNAELGVWGVCFLALLRRVSPLACDGWRGPLSHLLCPPGRVFNPPACPICIQELLVGEDLCRTPCGHDFHRDCLEDWVLSRRDTSAGCPLCRESLLMSENSDPSRLLLADCIM